MDEAINAMWWWVDKAILPVVRSWRVEGSTGSDVIVFGMNESRANVQLSAIRRVDERDLAGAKDAVASMIAEIAAAVRQ